MLVLNHLDMAIDIYRTAAQSQSIWDINTVAIVRIYSCTWQYNAKTEKNTQYNVVEVFLKVSLIIHTFEWLFVDNMQSGKILDEPS